MKKPVNPAAMAFWVLAVVFLIIDVPIGTSIRLTLNHVQAGDPSQHRATLLYLWSASRIALMDASRLAGIGVIIELLDHVRWNGLPPERQVVRRPMLDALRRLRTAGIDQ